MEFRGVRQRLAGERVEADPSQADGRSALGLLAEATDDATQVPLERADSSLRVRLLRQYQGLTIEDVYGQAATVLASPDGCCLRVEQTVPGCLHSQQDPTRATTAILDELPLLYGVRDQVAARLRAQGYRSIRDLTRHPRFGPDARRLATHCTQQEVAAVLELLRCRLGASHPLNVRLAGWVAAEEVMFLDLETLGLGNVPVIVFGLATISARGLEVCQYVARSLEEERAALMATVRTLRAARLVVTYGGRSADFSWLRWRLATYALPPLPACAHLDLLYPCRRRFANHGLPDFSLGTLEQHVLKLPRPAEDLPSMLVPDFYEDYLAQRNVGPLVAILGHNHYDLVALAFLLEHLVAEPELSA